MEGERWIDHFPSVLSIEVLRGRRQTSHQFSTDFMGVSRGLNHRFPCRVLLVSCFVLSSDRCDRFYNANPPHAISHRGGRFCHSSPPLHTFPQGVGGVALACFWHFWPNRMFAVVRRFSPGGCRFRQLCFLEAPRGPTSPPLLFL